MEKTSVAGGKTGQRIGRPLSFDRETALEQAMLLFWRHGYETTSVAELVAAMGITPPSLYAAFGDKKRLFLEAVRRYAGDPAALAAAVAGAPSAREAAAVLMRGAAHAYTGEATPRGCLLASATASGSAASADVREAVADVRRAIAAHLEARIARDVAEGALPPGTDPAALAGLVMAVNQGMSVLARDGAGRAQLLAVVEAALAAWPGSSPRSGAPEPAAPSTGGTINPAEVKRGEPARRVGLPIGRASVRVGRRGRRDEA